MIKFRVFASLFYLFSFFTLSAFEDYGFCKGWNSPFRLSLNHVEGRWLDNTTGYTSIGGFAASPLGSGGAVSFIDARGHAFNDGKWALNAGVGLRYPLECTDKIFGANVFFDYRRSQKAHNFYQVGLGLEYLSPCFDLRLNGYIPVGCSDEKSRFHCYGDYIGNFFAGCRQSRTAMCGVDLEIGKWLLPVDACTCFNLYGALSPYYYESKERNHRNNSDCTYGIGGRLETLLGDYFVFEVRGGYDKVYKGMLQGVVSFVIPLDSLFNWDCFSNDCCPDNCMIYQPVVRQEIIALGRNQCCWFSNF